MKKLTKLLPLIIILGAGLFLTACAGAKTKNNAPLCRLQWDYGDGGLECLSVQNLRALKSFKDICEGVYGKK